MQVVASRPGVLRNRLREARKQQRLTLRELAEKSQVSQQTIVWLEQDDGTRNVTTRVLLSLWEALEVDWHWLWYPERAA